VGQCRPTVLRELWPCCFLARHRGVRVGRRAFGGQDREVILGDRKWSMSKRRPQSQVCVASNAAPQVDVRSFKCHNWAYAIGDLEAVVREVARGGA